MSRSGLPIGDLAEHGPVSSDLAVPRSALAIGAHPDDIEFGCGATLAKWADAGCNIHHLVLTDGSKGTWDGAASAEQLIDRRRGEQRSAARVLGGGDVDFLDWVDGELASGFEQRRQVCRVIRRHRPEVVLGHDPWRRYRLHPDHRHAGWLAVDSVVAAREPTCFPDVGIGAHRPRALLLWEADEPNHVEEVSATMAVKIEALLAHRSQYRSTMGIAAHDEASTEDLQAFGQRVRHQAAAHGSLSGVTAGEAFRLIDDL